MKKWGALLLAALLGLACAGALAETTVTLDVSKNGYNIYPDGYKVCSLSWNEGDKYYLKLEDGEWYSYDSKSTHYILTGSSEKVDTVVDFYSIPHNNGTSQGSTDPVTYNVTFENLWIESMEYATAIRFNKDYNDGKGKNIVLNVTNTGDNSIKAGNHPAFAMNGTKKLTVNITMDCVSELEVGNQFGGECIIKNGEVHVDGALFTKDSDSKNYSNQTIPAPGHKYDAAWSYDKEGHWHICRRPLGTADAARATGICGEPSAKEPHTFAWVVDKEPGVGMEGERHEECNVCGYRRGAETLPALNLPHTGDSSHLMRWAALLGACCAGLACMARRKQR